MARPLNPEVSGATIEAEEALLGAILIDSAGGKKDAISAARRLVQPEYFLGYYPPAKPWKQCRRARIYMAMLSCQAPPHEINTALEMVRLHILSSGDCAYLCFCVSTCPCSLDYEDYAKAVAEYAKLRGVKPRESGSYEGLTIDSA